MSASLFPRFRAGENSAVSVLLVSPNSRLRLQLREKLTHGSWDLTEAGSGAEAMECLHESSSEILLLDALLPDLESGEFSAMVREQFPNVQILSVNSHTGQLLLGTSSPTPLSAQLTEMLYSGGNLDSNAMSPVQLHRMRTADDGGFRIRGMIGDSEPMRRVRSRDGPRRLLSPAAIRRGEPGRPACRGCPPLLASDMLRKLLPVCIGRGRSLRSPR